MLAIALPIKPRVIAMTWNSGTLGELYETGDLQPNQQWRIKESMRNLLHVWDSATPLRVGLGPPPI